MASGSTGDSAKELDTGPQRLFIGQADTLRYAVTQRPVPEQSEVAAASGGERDIAFAESRAFQDVYSDSVSVSIGPFGVALTFGLTDPRDATHRDTVSRIRVSPQMAYVLTQLLRKVLRKGKADGIGFDVPEEVLKSLDLEREL